MWTATLANQKYFLCGAIRPETLGQATEHLFKTKLKAVTLGQANMSLFLLLAKASSQKYLDKTNFELILL